LKLVFGWFIEILMNYIEFLFLILINSETSSESSCDEDDSSSKSASFSSTRKSNTSHHHPAHKMLITEEKMETVIKELQNSNLNRSPLNASAYSMTIHDSQPSEVKINDLNKKNTKDMFNLIENEEDFNSQHSNAQNVILSNELKQFINDNRDDDLNQMRDYCSSYMQVIPYMGSPFISLCPKSAEENKINSNEPIKSDNECEKEIEIENSSFSVSNQLKNATTNSTSLNTRFLNFSSSMPFKETISSSEPHYNVEEPTEPSHQSLKR
jgi:hypothetical protein